MSRGSGDATARRGSTNVTRRAWTIRTAIAGVGMATACVTWSAHVQSGQFGGHWPELSSSGQCSSHGCGIAHEIAPEP